MALLALALSGWLWAGSEGSLALVLRHADLWLPAGQTLQAQDVRGTLRSGGQIGSLHWRTAEWEVQATGVSVGWAPTPLLDGELQLEPLRLATLRITDRRPPTPVRPPTALTLPLRLRSTLDIGVLDWQGATAVHLEALRANYVFDSKEHRLEKASVRISSFDYSVAGTVRAQPPMALALDLAGTVPARLPRGGRTLTLAARASLRGTLATEAATLDLQAQLSPLDSVVAKGGVPVPRGTLSARLLPWRPQPIAQAQAEWQALDAALLWPQAPHTLLDGSAHVTPTDGGWQADVQLRNRAPAPWNRQGLPLQTLNARGSYRQGGWLLEALNASGEGGQVQASGRFDASQPPRWQGEARLLQLQPQALDTRLPPGPLDGEVQARHGPAGLDFELRLKASGQAGPGMPQGLAAALRRLTAVQLRGRWHDPLLQLDTLELQTAEARLAGRGELDLNRHAPQGDLTLSAPGLTARWSGQLSPTTGQGRASLQFSDVRQASRWLARWPGLEELPVESADGSLQVEGSWQGGWQDGGRQLAVNLTLNAPRLAAGVAPDGSRPWQLRDLQARLSGSVADFELGIRGQAALSGLSIDVDAQARAVRQSPSGGAPEGTSQWQATLAQAVVALRPGTATDTASAPRGAAAPSWRLELLAPVGLQARQTGQALTLSLGAGGARIAGPAEGTPSLLWQPTEWARTGQPGQQRTRWGSQGRIEGLPLAWLEALGQTRVAQFGLRGDLVFGGQWSAAGQGARGTESLSLQASLARRSGDLHLLAEDQSEADLRAGVREARLDLSLDEGRLQARMQWDSERAGQAQAEVTSPLQRTETGWWWAPEAPLSGQVRLQLPPVNAWSMLAPPGWRLRGTLDADARIEGTRAAPRWRGNLRAQDLAVRSVTEGIDFSGGTLRARLDGQTLRIDDFALQGASGGGSSGGSLRLNGTVRWLDSPDPGGTPLARWRIDLAVQAERLRVSTRADRRLVVSGRLNAQWGPSQLTLRGSLRADQALFTLPDDSTPALGEDVRVRRADASAPPPGLPIVRAGSAPRTGAVGALPMDLRVALDLGDDFQVRGRGLATRVAGQLELRNASEHSLQPQLSGELRAVKGSYRAYGQPLDIESGVLRFAGTYDNPALDVLAIRPNLTQKVGVHITGTVISPVIRLYADPELPDAEKLAWLVLGRAAGSGGAEAALLQRAALTLLGGNAARLPGNLAQALRLDEFSLRAGSTQTDGSATGATVTLGKRLSNEFYLAYERSLAGTLGTLYIFFDLTRRLTLRAQAGQQSAIDLIFTQRYD